MDSIDYCYEKTPHSTEILCVLFIVLCMPVVWVGTVASWRTALIPLGVLFLIFVPAVRQEKMRRAQKNAPALSLKRDLLVAKCKGNARLVNIPYAYLQSILYEFGRGFKSITIWYLDQGKEKTIDVDLAGVKEEGNLILQEIYTRISPSNNPRIFQGLLVCSPSKNTVSATAIGIH